MIRKHFGSRRGLARLVLEEMRWLTGAGRNASVNLGEVSRLVFVCRGNICRSAYAAEVARSLSFDAVSYGLDTRTGKPADAGMLAAARSFGHNLSAHLTSRLDEFEPRPSDLVAVFELTQLEQVHLRLPDSTSVPLGRWARPARTYIHDPYMSSPEFYRRSCEIIGAATQRLIADIHRAKARATSADGALQRSK